MAALAAASAPASRRRVLVTGGLGYIGSHTVVELMSAGHPVTIVDNLSNSHRGALARIRSMVTRPDELACVELDIRDRAALERLFADTAARGDAFGGCIHFAAFKAVGESRQKPLMYFDNNVTGSVVLLETLAKHGVKQFVFSSSCTVYGAAASPVSEDSSTGVGITNAYAQTKYTVETMLRHLQAADPSWRIAVLRYFNPVGAHASGLIGEDPCGIPNCLMPYALQVLVGRREKLTVFGNDYPTRDGTCIRDYIHVVDVARGHIDALRWLEGLPANEGTIDYFNFGTGRGTTVLELVAALEKASGKTLNKVMGARREGDLAEMWCVPEKAKRVLGWEAKYDIDTISEDAWRFQSQNPQGYANDGDGGGGAGK